MDNQSAMKGFDAGGADIAYTQTGGVVNLNGTLDVDNGTTPGVVKPMTGSAYVGADLKGGTLCGSGTIQGSLLAEGGTTRRATASAR